jgi:hypothetical protein
MLTTINIAKKFKQYNRWAAKKINLNACVSESVRTGERKSCFLDLAFLSNEYFEFRTSELMAVHRKRKHRENFDFS